MDFDLGGAIGGLTNGIFGMISQNKANKTNLQIARETNQLQEQMFYDSLQHQTNENIASREFNSSESAAQRAWEESMLNQQNVWNSAQQIAQRYREAGINPAVAMAGQSAQGAGSIPSGAAAGSSPVAGASVPNLHSPQVNPLPSPFVDVFSSMNILSQAKKNAADAAKTDAERKRFDEMFDAQIKKLKEEADKAGQETESLRIANAIQRIYGQQSASLQVSKLKEEVNATAQLAASYVAQGKYHEAEAALARSKVKTEKIVRSVKREERDILRKQNETFYNEFETRMQSLRADSSLKFAQAETENLLRDHRESLLKEDIKYKTSQIRTDAALRQKLAYDAVESYERARGQRYDADVKRHMMYDIERRMKAEADKTELESINPFTIIIR